jgi:hypothetical protein
MTITPPQRVLACAVLAAVLLLLLFVFNDRFVYRPMKPVSIEHIDYDSRSAGRDLSSVKEFSQPGRIVARDIDISFKMKVYSIGQYDGVFQTGPGNAGVRMEVSKPGTLALIAGKAVNTFILTDSLEPGKEYQVNLRIRGGHVHIALNGFAISGTYWKGRHFNASDIKVGTGWGGLRPFDGRISDFKVAYRPFRYHKRLEKTIDFTEELLGGLMLLLLVVYLRLRTRRKLSELWLGLGSARYVYCAAFAVCSMVFLTPAFERLLMPGGPLPDTNYRLPIEVNLWFVLLILSSVMLSAFFIAKRIDLADIQAKARFTATIVMCGFVVSYLFLYIQAMAYGADISVKAILPVAHRFEDFTNGLIWSKYQLYAGAPGHAFDRRWSFNYFPAGFLAIDMFLRQQYRGLIGYVMLFSLYFFFYCFFSMKRVTPAARVKYSLAFLCLSFPTMFTISTSNFEGLLFIILSLFFLFYYKNRQILSSFCLGFAIAMKLTPAVFLVLLLSDKRYKQLLYTVGFVALSTLVPLMMLDGGFNGGLMNYWHRQMANLSVHQASAFESIKFGVQTLRQGSSLICGLRLLSGSYFPPLESLVRPWLMFSFLVFAGLFVYVVVYEKAAWKRVMLLTIAMTILPFLSFDYKLIQFYIPLFLLLNDDRPDKYSSAHLFLLGLLLVPKQYLGPWMPPVLDPFIMIFMAVFIIVSHGRISLEPIRTFRFRAGASADGHGPEKSAPRTISS